MLDVTGSLDQPLGARRRRSPGVVELACGGGAGLGWAALDGGGGWLFFTMVGASAHAQLRLESATSAPIRRFNRDIALLSSPDLFLEA
jgi:uncharacterized membrane protein YfcA